MIHTQKVFIRRSHHSAGGGPPESWSALHAATGGKSQRDENRENEQANYEVSAFHKNLRAPRLPFELLSFNA